MSKGIPNSLKCTLKTVLIIVLTHYTKIVNMINIIPTKHKNVSMLSS